MSTDSGPNGGRRQRSQSPTEAKGLIEHRAEVLSGEGYNFFVVAHGRQDVDEAEQLRLEDLVMHGQVHGRLGPPTPLKERRCPASGEEAQVFADSENSRLEIVRGRRHGKRDLSRVEEMNTVYTSRILLKNFPAFASIGSIVKGRVFCWTS